MGLPRGVVAKVREHLAQLRVVHSVPIHHHLLRAEAWLVQTGKGHAQTSHPDQQELLRNDPQNCVCDWVN